MNRKPLAVIALVIVFMTLIITAMSLGWHLKRTYALGAGYQTVWR